MLGAIDIAFGDDLLFTGPLYGVVSFFVVKIAVLLAAEVAVRICRRFGRGASLSDPAASMPTAFALEGRAGQSR